MDLRPPRPEWAARASRSYEECELDPRVQRANLASVTTWARTGQERAPPGR